MFQDSEVEMQDRVGALRTAVDDAVDHDLPPECAKMLPDIVFRTHLDVFCRALLGYPPARVEPMTVRTASARCKGRAGEAACFSYRSAHIQGGGTASTRMARGSRAVPVHYRAHRWR